MKFISWFLAIVILILGGVYALAFTQAGNNLVQPFAEKKIQEFTKLDSKLSTFTLGLSSFEIKVDLDTQNSVHIIGNYDIIRQSFNTLYDVKFSQLENLESLTKKPLQGKLFTNGNAKGSKIFMQIDGKSDLAKSITKYHVELTNLDPTSIIATIESADLASLLKLIGEKPYATGKINTDINFKNIKPHQLDGTIALNTVDGKINHDFMSKAFELNIPKTTFNMKLDATLKGDDIKYDYLLDSNLAKIKSDGLVTPEPLKVDLKYDLDVQELAVLKPITQQDIRGPLGLKGTAKGTRKNMIVEGVSNIADSDTHFSTILTQLKPSSVNANIDKLKIKKLLYMLHQPAYGDGILSLNADLQNLKKGELKGTLLASVKKGLLNSKYISKEQKFKTQMPTTHFNFVSNTELNGNLSQTKFNFKSTLVSLDIDKALYNLEDKSIESDFKTSIPDLSKLFFVTERELQGDIALDGSIKKHGDEMELYVHSNVADGKLDAKLINDDLDVDLQSIQTLKALEMLVYPQIFDASLNGKLNYNLKEKLGKFQGNLLDGKFTQNIMLSLVKQYGKVDLYKEKFTGDVYADINKEKLLASFELASNNSSIATKAAKLDSKSKTIDARIDITANKHPIGITIKGKTSSPDVSIDAASVIQNEVEKVVGEKLNGLLKGFFN